MGALTRIEDGSTHQDLQDALYGKGQSQLIVRLAYGPVECILDITSPGTAARPGTDVSQLEHRCVGNCIVGVNPTPSANLEYNRGPYGHSCSAGASLLAQPTY